GRVAPDVTLTKQLVIAVGRVPARDASISGRVVDETGKPLADVVVRANPEHEKMGMWGKERTKPPRTAAFATSNADGTFEIRGLDRDTYEVGAELDDKAPAWLKGIAGGTRGVAIELTPGLRLAGAVATADG